MSDKGEKVAEKMGVHAPNSQVNINTLIVGHSPETDQAQKISWQQVCLAMLEDRKHLTSNRLLPFEMQRDLINDNIFVDLALVQQKKADKRSEDVLPEQGSQLYEPSGYTETERFEFSRFLTDVLGTKKNEKLTIIGEPGSGKTTLLQKIAFWLLDNTEDLVIWVSLGELRDKDLRDYLTENWLQEAMMYADPSIRSDWEKQFNQRSVWLLLDGLDEMTADARDALSLRGWVAQARVIMTCRLNVWQANPRILQGFETYRMLEFQVVQMQQFIQKWFRDDSNSGQNLQQALSQPGKERIRDLARNPLRLTLLCSAWHLQEGKLPDTKAELYKQFIDDLYEWKSNRFPTTGQQRNQLNTKLGELAKEAIDKEFTRFRLRHSLVCEILGEPSDQESMLHLALELGWLNTVGIDMINPRQPVYAFFHPTFQEYFAARSIDDWDFFLPREHEDKPVNNSESNKCYRIFEPQWKEVILLWLGQDRRELKEQKVAFIEALEGFNAGCKNFYRHQAIFLAAAGIAELSNCSKADEIVERVALWSFGEFDDERKQWRTFLEPLEKSARLSLAETDRSRTISKITSLLARVDDEEIRYEVASFLGKLDRNNSQATSTLIDLLHSVQAERLRLRIAGNLVQLGCIRPEVEEALLKTLKSKQADWYRRDAARYLLQIDDNCPEAISTLIELFCKSKDEILRSNLDIDEIGANHLVLKALLKIFFTSQDIIHQRQAGNYLGIIVAKQFKLLESLLSFLKIRKSILNTLDLTPKKVESGTFYLRKIITLINSALTTKDKKLRRQSLWELLKIGIDHPEIAKAFLETFVSRGDERRKTILKFAQTLELESSGIIDIGTELLDIAEDDWLKYSIATGLNRIAPENAKAIVALKNLLNNCQHENTMRWMADTLKKVEPGNSQATAVFLELLQSTSNRDIAYWSAQSLGEISNDKLEVVQTLSDLLISTSERRVAGSIVYGLKKVFEADALALLVTSLKGYLSDEIRENNFPLYSYAFEILWHCASRMPYPIFYSLWHNSPDGINTEST